jgi:glycine hydroxymethyltransferase
MDIKPIPALRRWFDQRYGDWICRLRSELGDIDPFVMNSVDYEIRRQTSAVNLIASESMASRGVMAASGSPSYVQTVEGRSGRRWYPAVAGVDALETEAESRARLLFGLPEANVQPHSATQANQAVYLAALSPGDTILAPAFTSGGHLSHGFTSSFAQRFYKIQVYATQNFDAEISLDEIERCIRDVRPKLVIAGCSAYPRQTPFEAIVRLAASYGARALADITHTAGFIAAGLHPPVNKADFATLSLHKTMCGPRGGIALSQMPLSRELSKALFPGLQGAIQPSQLAAKTVCLREATSEDFKKLQAAILGNAKAMAKAFLNANIAMYTGGTDTHMLVIRSTDPAGGADDDVDRLLKAGILANSNYIHGDAVGKSRKSGLRIGTTWITQLGFDERDAEVLAYIIADVLDSRRYDSNFASRLHQLVDSVVNKHQACERSTTMGRVYKDLT